MIEMNVGDEREVNVREKSRIESRPDGPFRQDPDCVCEKWIGDENLVMNLKKDRCVPDPGDSETGIREDRRRDHMRSGGNRLT